VDSGWYKWLGDESRVQIFKDKFIQAFGEGGKGSEVEEDGDIVAFARERLGFDPDEKPRPLMRVLGVVTNCEHSVC
jgi:hypothetical protein